MNESLPRTKLSTVDASEGIRLQSPGYFVTICTQKRACLFGSIANGEMQLNEAGRIVQAVWLELPVRFPQVGVDSFIVMPNHIHGIILVGAQFIAPLNAVPDTLGDVLRAYKASSSRLIRQSINSVFAWQRNYYEHVIRSEESLNRIRQYILDNPARWACDRENPAATAVELDCAH